MSNKKSLSMAEFAKLHNAKIKGKISQKDLIKNLGQLKKIKNIEIHLQNCSINYTLPCVVEKINFGKIDFRFSLIELNKNFLEAKKEIEFENEYMDIYECEDIYADYVTSYIDCRAHEDEYGLDRDRAIAPHIGYGSACFGGFVIPIVNALSIADYAGIGILLQDYIKSMNKKSHGYMEAVVERLHTCDYCDDLIRPYIYKTSKNLDDSFLCKRCKNK